ncbi:HIT family protein [Duganella sp. HH101]|uniref:HIT family protein n=1 Tax=Duganella sp. HH101 TaxID=1781066 RepID=UPI0008FCC2C2|nr:HIT family protein [Duganella sp. HH101]
MKKISNLDIPKNTRCAFCDYLSGNRPYTVLHKDENIAILVTREQRGLGHVLAIPIRHVESILDIEDEEAAELMKVIRKVATAIDQAYGRPGISIWQNNGIPAGQAIAHVHFHIAGTLEIGGTERGTVPEISLEETNAIATRILQFF